MLQQVANRVLINNREKTYLTEAVAAATESLIVASTDLAADAASSNTWKDNDYMIVGEPGEEGSEIMQIKAAVTSATSLSIDREGQTGGLRHAHPIGTPVYRIAYNRVRFGHNTKDTEDGINILTTISLQPDDEYTRYEDTANETGYGFVRFNNEQSGAVSNWSDGVNYEESGIRSSRDPRTLWSMREKVRLLLGETEPDSILTNDMVDDALNDKQREIAHIRLWTFLEGEKSFSSVANQFAYNIPLTVQKVHGCLFDTQPLNYHNRTDWDLSHFDTDQVSSDPGDYTIWDRQIKIHPRPASAASATTLGADLSDTEVATCTVVATASFKRGDYYRFIINSEVIYATGATATTFTGLLRGKEGTTVDNHTSGDTVTERNIVFTCHVEPNDLFKTQNRTAVPEPEVLTYGAAIDLAPFVDKKDMITFWENKYNKRIKDLENKYSSKQTAQHGRIKDMNEVLGDGRAYRNSNLYPRNVG